MGSHGSSGSAGGPGKIAGWTRSPLVVGVLAVIALMIGVVVGVSIAGPGEDESLPFAQYDYQVRTEQLEGVVIFPWIYNVQTGVPVGGRDCEPMLLAPIGNHSGIFVSDENGQIIQQSTVREGIGTFSSDGTRACEIRFSLRVPLRDRYRVTAGYIAGAPPSYSVVVASGERAQIDIPAP